jgi:hypothetical protein
MPCTAHPPGFRTLSVSPISVGSAALLTCSRTPPLTNQLQRAASELFQVIRVLDRVLKSQKAVQISKGLHFDNLLGSIPGLASIHPPTIRNRFPAYLHAGGYNSLELPIDI